MDGQRRFDKRTLLKLARRRGIILPNEWDRESLANYLSRLVWSWPELQHLLALTEVPERREKLTSSRISTDASAGDVRAAVDAVKTAREGQRDEAYTIKQSQNTANLAVLVRYTELDLSRTRLQQRVTREVTIDFEPSPTGYVLRHQASDRAREIGREIVKTLSDGKATPFEPTEITLKGIATPEIRTQFFLDLMSQVPDMDLRNVTAVNIVRPEPPPENGEDDEDETAQEAVAMLGVVRKAALEGQGLLTSGEFTRLRTEGFFLSRSVWRSIDPKTPDSPEIEFEADFADAKECTGFRYDVRGQYERRVRGEEGLRKTRSPVPADVRVGLLRNVEQAAQRALEKALLSSTGGAAQIDPFASVPIPNEGR